MWVTQRLFNICFIFMGLLMVVYGNVKASSKVYLLTPDTVTAGSVHEIVYHADVPDRPMLRLVVWHNFGMYSQQAVVNDCNVLFNTTSVIWQHSGHVVLKLYQANNLLATDHLVISPDTAYPPEVEAYCGPKQILAGGEDFTMVIGSSLDSLDNPWPQGTEMTYRYIFKSHLKVRQAETKALHGYVRFFSDNEAGTPVISVAWKNTARSEFDITVYPNYPTDFILSYDRAHPYADGKQITTITTTEIMDTLGNQIADGSMVYFKISTSKGEIMQAMATTVAGIANVMLPAPGEATRWSVQAYIEDYVQSSPLTISYLPSVRPFSIQWTDDRELIIGPVTGFLNQYVPNHTEVEITLCHNDRELLKTIYTQEGMAQLDLGEMDLEDGYYTVTVNCGGQIHGKTIIIE